MDSVPKTKRFLLKILENPFRFDSNVLHEALHKSDYLQSRCGPFDPNTASNFRQVLYYGAGDNTTSNQALEELRELLLPAALKVFGESDNVEAKKVIVDQNFNFFMKIMCRPLKCFKFIQTCWFLDIP